MKALGYCLLVAGGIYIVIAFNMDVSVSTPSTYVPGYGRIGGGDVANLDLMQQRQNHLIVACLITLIGALLSVFGKDSEKPEQENASKRNTPPANAAFDGDANLASDPYRLWLVDKYQITRNEVFGRFVFGEQTFESLDDALALADREERRLLTDLENALAEKRAADEERELEAIRIREEAELEWEKSKPKLIATFVTLGILFAALIVMQIESPEEKEARLAAESEAAKMQRVRAEEELGLELPDDSTNMVIKEDPSGALCATDSVESYIPIPRHARTYGFDTEESAADLKARFANVLGEGQPAYRYLDGDSDDWAWRLDDRIVTLNHIDYDGGTGKVVCVFDLKE